MLLFYLFWPSCWLFVTYVAFVVVVVPAVVLEVVVVTVVDDVIS